MAPSLALQEDAVTPSEEAPEEREVLFYYPVLTEDQRVFLAKDTPVSRASFEDGRFRLEARAHSTNSGFVGTWSPNRNYLRNARYEIDVQLSNGGTSIGFGDFDPDGLAIIAQVSPVTGRSIIYRQNMGNTDRGVSGSREELTIQDGTSALNPGISDVNSIGAEALEQPDGEHEVRQFINGRFVQGIKVRGLNIKQWAVGVIGKDSIGVVGWFNNLRVSIRRA